MLLPCVWIRHLIQAPTVDVCWNDEFGNAGILPVMLAFFNSTDDFRFHWLGLLNDNEQLDSHQIKALLIEVVNRDKRADLAWALRQQT